MYLDPRDEAMIGKETDCDNCGDDFILQLENMSFDTTERCVLVRCSECMGLNEPFADKVENSAPCNHGTPVNQNCPECKILAEDLTVAEIDQYFGNPHIRDFPEIDPWQ